ncbi:hypothetical protein O0881_04200 [Janthinobacterium sp. SUN100]|uniref:hypothetical protein n=1 Tax=Janthinobacterium sp. SUN100 TaxID=3004101 RepID=UPI0025AF98DD|nr:hypothetical protein [Janthinobacterium sp. SUN100]MDN2701199.1 hypothetical protein [Janthinobacterium sp. SUN100]
MWGFWSSFNVNVLQYIDIPGVVKNSLFPLLFSMSSFVVGLVIGHFVQPLRNSEMDNDAYNSSFGRRCVNTGEKYCFFWIVFSCVVLLFGRENKWDILSVLIALPVSIFLTGKNVLDDIFPERSIRVTAVFFFTVAIPFSYSLGLRDAEKIISGKNYLYVVSTIGLHDQVVPAVPDSNIRYLGQVSDFGFFYNPLNEVVSVSKLKPGDFLSFKHHKKYQKNIIEVFKWAWDGLWGRFTGVFDRD